MSNSVLVFFFEISFLQFISSTDNSNSRCFNVVLIFEFIDENAFSSINSKINTTLKQRELELSVEDINYKKEISKKKTSTEFDIKKFTPRSKKKIKSKGDLKRNFSKKSQKKMFFEKDLLKEKRNNNLKRKKDVTKKTN